MAVMSVTEESVRQLEEMAGRLEELTEEIRAELGALQETWEEQQDGLGAHSGSIRDLIREMEQIEKDAAGSAAMLALRLEKSALIRRMHIEQDLYQEGRDAEAVSAPERPEGPDSEKRGVVRPGRAGQQPFYAERRCGHPDEQGRRGGDHDRQAAEGEIRHRRCGLYPQ